MVEKSTNERAADENPQMTPVEREEALRCTREFIKWMGIRYARVADVQPRAVSWLWPGRLALGKTHLFFGDPGVGKSFATMDLAARVSTGRDWPDGSPGGKPGRVLLLSGEDSLEETLHPRLSAHRADLNRVAVAEVRYLETDPYGKLSEFPPELDRDLRYLDQFLSLFKDHQLVIIDPIAQFLGDVDGNREKHVRNLLLRLSKMAEARQVACILVSHATKIARDRPVSRVAGSMAFVGHTRIAWGFVRDGNDPTRTLFLPLKNNLAPVHTGHAFRIVEGRVAWEPEPVERTLEEALQSPTRRLSPRLQAAIEWFSRRLACGPVESALIYEEALRLGFNNYLLKRAKVILNIESHKMGWSQNTRWQLRLPDRTGETS
jgi:hypothetical protein